MARSTYIYIVSGSYGPEAGFTVKYELMGWLKQHLPMRSDQHVFRLMDGWNHTGKLPVDITEWCTDVFTS